MGAILIRDALACDPAWETERRVDILVRDGRIAQIADGASLTAGPEIETFDAANRILMPGLINTHTHGHANLSKGMADLWPLEASLVNGSWMGGGRTQEIAYLSTLLGAADMITKGCTGCFDLVFAMPEPVPALFLATARAYSDAGMRAVLAPMVADRTLYQSIPGLLDSLPAELRTKIAGLNGPAPDVLLDGVRAVLEAPLPDRTSPAIAPTIPHQCSDGFILTCAELAEAKAIPMHMHIAESRLQVLVAHDLYRQSPIRHLDALGVLNDRFVAAHGIWLDGADLDIVAERGVRIAHVPGSNLRLGSGIAYTRAMLDRGITVGIATDGANSADAINMFEAMRHASNMSRVLGQPRARWLGYREILTMGTRGGAALIGQADGGRIAEGAPADFTLLDIDSLNFLPLNNPMNQIVTAENGASVTDVMIAGRWALRDRRLAFIDLDELRRRLREIMPGLRERNAPARALSRLLEPHVVAFAEGRLGEPLPVSRYVPVEGRA